MLQAIWKLFVPSRVEVDELLDAADAPLSQVERSLRDLRRFNRFLGGRRSWRRLVREAGGVEPGQSILEIGTGTSDLLETIDHGVLRIGLDLKIDHLTYGRRIGDRSVLRVVGDALHLPFRNETVDLVGSSHFFHHFSPRENETIVQESLRVSRRAVFVTDTVRNVLPWLFVWLLGRFRLVGTITRFDAPASVLQGYTMNELREFVQRFEGVSTSIRRMIPFRFGLTVTRGTPSDG